jgi:hypothetical protein
MRKFYAIILCMMVGTGTAWGKELPIPSYRNSVIISIEHYVGDSAEVNYIKNHFNFGLYAWLSFSKTHIDPVLNWHASWEDADQGIQDFKSTIENYIQMAEGKKVRLHIVLCSGLARGLSIYREAKEEDVRNCQWYNDNNIASDKQILKANAMNTYVFGTLSRYARKMHCNLEAKTEAALSFLKQRMDEKPETLIALSGWGEAELNYNRIDHDKSVQDYFCDYSPFAVLEFRDWIQHSGMYDDATGEYKGQGYAQGGAKYQGTSGLNQFNQDFGSSFTSWDLKCYNWSLTDDYDTDPTDAVNNDPHRIPHSSYSHGNMIPTSGANYIAGGFDPPREMQPGNKFWDLWNLFRESMVHHFVLDVAKWASEAGIAADKWFSHQIPGDYLFGTKPEDVNKNARYYTSASPLWSADIQPYGSLGASVYDIKYPASVNPNEFVRTTEYALSVIARMSSNWACMEYDAETYPPGLGVTQSSPDVILDQYLNLYSYKPHIINFWRWWDESGEHRIKGMNKEKALQQFIRKIRDKARRTDLSIVFDPPRVADFSGEHDKNTGENTLQISGKIWKGHSWEWKDWGDFSSFEIYRGEAPDFSLDEQHLLTETDTYTYTDLTAQKNTTYYYRIRAINSKGNPGSASLPLKLPGDTVYILNLKAEEGGTTNPEPGLYGLDSGVEVEITAVPDEMFCFSGWSGSESGSENPLTVLMDRDKKITAHFSETNLYPPLNFQGQKVANRSLVQVEYINSLTWEVNPLNQNVNTYRIYEFKAETLQLLAELDPSVFQYAHRRVERDKEYTYRISVVDSLGHEGPPATIKVI